MKDPQFFSLEGVDIHDDAALEAFVHHVWERFTQVIPRPQGSKGPPKTCQPQPETTTTQKPQNHTQIEEMYVHDPSPSQ